MGSLKVLNETTPSTPGAGYTKIYVDSTDRKAKTVDQNGVVSILVNDGMHDLNLITNGGFTIQQRVATASTLIAGASTSTRGGVVADCWSVTSTVTTNLNWSQTDTNGAQETGLQSRYYGTMLSSVTARKYMISQYITGSEMAHLRGKKVRVSLKHNQKVGAGQVYHLGLLYLTAAGTVDVDPTFLTGAWSGSTGIAPAWAATLLPISPDTTPTGENGTVNGSYLDVTSVATTWTRSSCVFTVPTSAKNLVVVFFSDVTSAIGDNLAVAEFQLTEGADIVEFNPTPLAVDLMRCQRRYCKSFPLTTVPAASVTEANAAPVYGTLGKAGSGIALAAAINVQYPIQMFRSPTAITLFTPIGAGASIYRITGTTPAVQGAAATRGTTDRGFCATATSEATVNGAVGDIIGVHYTASAEFVN